MIKRISSLFAGHVDLGDLGQHETPANERRYSKDHLSTIFSKSEALAVTMDKLGYDTLWFAEHHFQHEGYECIPNIMLLSLHLSHLTEKLNFGCGFNITPMWHPLRLAEDFAMVDHMTQGRVKFGVGRGYHTREVETLDGPMIDKDANRKIFEEQVEIIFKAFNEDSFSHKGEHYTIPADVPYRGYQLKELTLVPRPLNLPVECWQPVVSATEHGLDFMMRHGIKGIVGGGSALMVENSIHAFLAAHERAGIDAQLGTNLGLGISFHLAPTHEQAVREATPFYEEHVKMFAPLGFLGRLGKEQHLALMERGGVTKAGLPTLEDNCKAGSWYCGPAEGFVEFLQEVAEKYPGLEDINVQSSMGTPQSVMIEQLQQFAEDVMPKVRAA